jgi:hypothetical protein
MLGQFMRHPLPMQLALYFIIGFICAVVNVAAFSMLFHGGSSVEMATPASFAISGALLVIRWMSVSRC